MGLKNALVYRIILKIQIKNFVVLVQFQTVKLVPPLPNAVLVMIIFIWPHLLVVKPVVCNVINAHYQLIVLHV